jgi:hypothetical protein
MLYHYTTNAGVSKPIEDLESFDYGSMTDETSAQFYSFLANKPFELAQSTEMESFLNSLSPEQLKEHAKEIKDALANRGLEQSAIDADLERRLCNSKVH